MKIKIPGEEKHRNAQWNERMIEKYRLLNYYERMPYLNRIIDLKRLRIMKEFLKKGSIIELGCGEGVFIGSFAGNRRKTGVDISEKVISIAKKRYPGINFLARDARNTKITEKFDNVVCSEVLEHVKDYGKVINEAKRLLKKDGIFIASVPNDTIRELGKRIFKSFGLLKMIECGEGIHNEWHINKFNGKSIQKALEKNGFRIIKMKRIPFFLMPVNYIIKCCINEGLKHGRRK